MIRSNDGNAPKNLILDEKSTVEEPLLQQLASMGWTVLRLGMRQKPAASFRTHLGEVVLRPELQAALRKINPFLKDDQVDEVVRRIVDFPPKSLVESNRDVLELLLHNTTVSVNHDTGEPSPTVHYVDFETPENNSFIAISQFKVSIPGTDHCIIPDITLFLNGLPIAVIECKSPKVHGPVPEAIDQLLRYSQQRGDPSEGNARLFHYNQFVVATCGVVAKFGTITTHIEKHFFRWLDPYPLTVNALSHGATGPNDQQRLVAGMCAQRNLLDLIQSFTIFTASDKGHTIKIVARYQQFRAVQKAIQRLREGQTPEKRSGIIWHTQGSGKSLTMMFMARLMRRLNEFAAWKIVFINDRSQLEEQLSDTSRAIGQEVKVARDIADLKRLLSETTPDIVMAMMQKFQERDLDDLKINIFPRLNTSDKVLIMVDEAHRSQYRLLGANLDRALPFASRVAYTGTPIDKTEKTFGDYIDKYTMRESIEDGSTLAIVYEGRTHNAEIADRKGLDDAFEDVFSDYNLAQRLKILSYNSRDAYLEAEPTIRAKAADMVEHYVTHVFPNGFKAQVVANSRVAAARYKKCLDDAILARIEALKQDNPLNIDLDLLSRLETAVIISGSQKDELPVRLYVDENYHRTSVRRFKMPFGATDGQGSSAVNGNVGILIVNNMLLTGFDAPVEQVMYLDQVMRDHNLLQTIARVNRVADEHKERGFVVDYVGIGHHLKKALEAYAEREQQEVLDAIEEGDQELGELVQARREIWDLLNRHGISDFSEMEVFYDLFADEEIRFAYLVAFRKLTSLFNLVLPRKEALDHFEDYQNFVKVNRLAELYFRDAQFSMRGIPKKLREITDAYLVSQGISLKVAPISILDDNFEKDLQTHKRPKTKAAAVEHAIRNYIDLNQDEDPELFASFAEELRRILEAFAADWELCYRELEKLREKIRAREKQETYGLDRKRQIPVFNFIKADIFENRPLTEDEIAVAVDLTQNLYLIIEREVQLTGLWGSTAAQNRLGKDLQDVLLSERFFSKLPGIFEKHKEFISRLKEWARLNESKIKGA